MSVRQLAAGLLLACASTTVFAQTPAPQQPPPKPEQPPVYEEQVVVTASKVEMASRTTGRMCGDGSSQTLRTS